MRPEGRNAPVNLDCYDGVADPPIAARGNATCRGNRRHFHFTEGTALNQQTKPPNSAQKVAQKYFAKTAAQDDTLAKQTLKKERAVTAAKTARLRDLRLAKEAQDKEEADRLAKETGVVPPVRRKRATAVKPAKMIRMSY